MKLEVWVSPGVARIHVPIQQVHGPKFCSPTLSAAPGTQVNCHLLLVCPQLCSAGSGLGLFLLHVLLLQMVVVVVAAGEFVLLSQCEADFVVERLAAAAFDDVHFQVLELLYGACLVVGRRKMVEPLFSSCLVCQTLTSILKVTKLEEKAAQISHIVESQE